MHNLIHSLHYANDKEITEFLLFLVGYLIVSAGAIYISIKEHHFYITIATSITISINLLSAVGMSVFIITSQSDEILFIVASVYAMTSLILFIYIIGHATIISCVVSFLYVSLSLTLFINGVITSKAIDRRHVIDTNNKSYQTYGIEWSHAQKIIGAFYSGKGTEYQMNLEGCGGLISQGNIIPFEEIGTILTISTRILDMHQYENQGYITFESIYNHIISSNEARSWSKVETGKFIVKDNCIRAFTWSYLNEDDINIIYRDSEKRKIEQKSTQDLLKKALTNGEKTPISIK